ncbi:hypothetical protein [Glutamicibacter uratoxydans]|uniref:hypothetical protein n=1 Tax=Glutamicibacter uratoxydans TaxID=43667 RepID=UPI003D6F086A
MSRTPVRRAAVAGPSTTDQLTIAVDKDSGPVNIFAGTSGDAIIELVYDKLFAPSP